MSRGIKSAIPAALQPFARSVYLRALEMSRSLQAPYYRLVNTGRGAFIDGSAQVLGWRSIRIERNVVVAEGCWLNVNGPPGAEPQIVIGEGSLIGRRATISSGRQVLLGSFTLLGPDCKIIGADHVFETPWQPYGSTGVTASGTIEIETNCWLGTSVMVVGSVRVGRGSVIGAGAVITRDVPPFSIVVGNPGRVIKRFDFLTNRWVPAAEFTAEMELAMPTHETYLTALRRTGMNYRVPVRAAGRSRGNSA